MFRMCYEPKMHYTRSRHRLHLMNKSGVLKKYQPSSEMRQIHIQRKDHLLEHIVMDFVN